MNKINRKSRKEETENKKSESSSLPVVKPGFEKLRIWKKAYELMLEVHKITKDLPKEERFKLKDQPERSSSSVVDAIAEGYSTYYYNDKIRSYYLARRESGETQSHCRKMEGKGYISVETSNRLIAEYEGLIRGINSMINRIKEQRDREKEKS